MPLPHKPRLSPRNRTHTGTPFLLFCLSFAHELIFFASTLLDSCTAVHSLHAHAHSRTAFCLLLAVPTAVQDDHICNTDVPDRPGSSMFCVFDGHGGSLVAHEAAKQLLTVVTSTEKFRHGNKSAETLSKALYDGLIELDVILRQIPTLKSGVDHSGATAITSFITPTHIVIGNAGDSRAVLARGDGVHFGTKDHKPTDVEERSRVEVCSLADCPCCLAKSVPTLPPSLAPCSPSCFALGLSVVGSCPRVSRWGDLTNA